MTENLLCCVVGVKVSNISKHPSVFIFVVRQSKKKFTHSGRYECFIWVWKVVWVIVHWCVSHAYMLGLCGWPVVGSDSQWMGSGH